MRAHLLALAAVAPLPLVACGPAGDVRPPAPASLPFLADDYPAALAEARARDLPIFVESWAPW